MCAKVMALVLSDCFKVRDQEPRFISTMYNIFHEIDLNESGCISMSELELALADSSMDALLSALKLNVNEVQILFAYSPCVLNSSVN